MNLFSELKRRNVLRVGAAYLVMAWVVAQVADLVLDGFGAPDWVMRAVLMALAFGFLPTVVLAWIFELTPDGIRKDKDVDHSKDVDPRAGRKLDFFVIGALSVVILFFAVDKFFPQAFSDAESDAVQTPAPRDASIAVLPFAHHSGATDDLYVTDGIHDDLLTQLAKIHDLKVVARSTVMRYRETQMSIADIARELGVSAILQGGVQRAGKRIRINAKLIDVATDRHVWAEQFDRELTIENLFDIQSDIAARIVTAVKGRLTPQERRALEGKPTTSLAAWEAYSRAREALRSAGYNADKYRAAQPLLEQAVRLDPRFHLAHAGLVQVHALAHWMGYGDAEGRRAAARHALERAQAVAPDSPAVQTAEGHFMYHFELDFDGALAAYQRALAATPGDAEGMALVGLAQRRLGRYDASADSLLRAYANDPGNLETISATIETLTLMNDSDRLKRLIPTVREQFPAESDFGAEAVLLAIWADGDVALARSIHAQVVPNSGEAYFEASLALAWASRDLDAVVEVWERPEIVALVADNATYRGDRELDLGWAYQLKGRETIASQLLHEAVAMQSESMPGESLFQTAVRRSGLAFGLALLGEHERAVDIARSVMRDYPLALDHISAMSIHAGVCQVLALAGYRDEALQMIADSLDQPNGFKRWFLYLDPRWDFMRDDARFTKLIEPRNLDAGR